MIEHFPATLKETETEYDFREIPLTFPSFKNCSLFEVHIVDRFPDYGYSKNPLSDLAIRIMKGKSIHIFVHKEGGLNLMRGSTFEIPKNTPYYIVAEPSAVLYVVSNQRIESMQQEIVTF